MKQFSWQKLLIGLALAAGCMLVGATIPTTNQALGEVRGGAPEPPAFQSGGSSVPDAARDLGDAASNGRTAGTAGNDGPKDAGQGRDQCAAGGECRAR